MSKGVHHEFQAGAGHDDHEGSSDRSFGFVFATVFALIGLYNAWHHGRAWPWLALVAAGFLAVALIRPAVLAPLNRLWMKFGLLLAMIINPIVLGILFIGKMWYDHNRAKGYTSKLPNVLIYIIMAAGLYFIFQFVTEGTL